jgi:hypothetical protein
MTKIALCKGAEWQRDTLTNELIQAWQTALGNPPDTAALEQQIAQVVSRFHEQAQRNGSTAHWCLSEATVTGKPDEPEDLMFEYDLWRDNALAEAIDGISDSAMKAA